MRKGEFDLTGKAIDCSGLRYLGDAGKRIFLAVKLACKGVISGDHDFSNINFYPYLMIDDTGKIFGCSNHLSIEVVQPSDVLGQAAIEAAMDGATIVFEGDEIPPNQGIKSYYHDGDVCIWLEEQEGPLLLEGDGESNLIIAYKILEEDMHKAFAQFGGFDDVDPSIESRILAEKVKASDVLSQGAKHLSDRAATYDNPEGERSMGATVEAFESITGHSLTEEQGWLFMALLKAVRSQQGNYKLDNYEDGAAYFALMAESASEARR